MLERNKFNLIWIDLEMTGLSPEVDHIIEIATLITDPQLIECQEGPSMVVYQTEEILDQMNTWCKKQHGLSGLTERVGRSTISLQEAEERTLAFLAQYSVANSSPMCGNTICHDRRFLAVHMPRLERFFSYRNLDVSTIKELAKRWRPDVINSVAKESKHLAMDDIKESIKELQHYRQHWLY